MIVKPVPPNSLEVGDLVVTRNAEDIIVVHRLVKILPSGRGITKGDSLLLPDAEQVELSGTDGIVVALVRRQRLIPISTGPRSWLKKVYAILSRTGLTCGAVKLRVKNVLTRYVSMPKSNGLKPEDRFILSVIRRVIPESTSHLNWAKLVDTARDEGVAGILFLRLKSSNIPRSVIKQLEDYYNDVVHSNFIHLHALEQLEEALRQAEIEITALKGASLLDKTYTSFGMRPMEDIDLMVHPNDRLQFVNLLYKMKYKKDPGRPDCYLKNQTIIDLHTHALKTERITGREGLFPSGMAPVWEKSVPWREGFRWIRRPDEADNVFLLIQHSMKHSFSRFIWFVDIYLLLQDQTAEFWIRLSEKATYYDQRRPLTYMLYLLERLFDYKPPAGYRIRFLPEEISRIERAILNTILSDQPLDQLGPLLSFFCIQGFKKRILFAWETVFLKKKVLQEEFGRFYNGDLPLLYPIRFRYAAVQIFKQFFLILKMLIFSKK